MWVWAVFLLAVAGLVVRRLSRQTEIAELALAVSLEQQSVMLVNEERSRQQIALLLHDRVQAGLMTACLELRMAIAPGADVDRQRIDAIIARLDDIRGMDVRQAARTLSPDLVNVDLHTALQELAGIYEPGMRTVIDLSPSITGASSAVSADTYLACYRILEQGLLNAAVHGGATQCTLSMSVSDNGLLTLALADNGRGLPAKSSTPGFGSAVIDSWCRVMDGDWRLEQISTGGVRLTAWLTVDDATGLDLRRGDVSLL
jgi:signal transduction histidine kinase